MSRKKKSRPPARERKAPAGTIAGPCLDTTWQTPPELLEPIRIFCGGRIHYDAATTRKNPTRAMRFSVRDGLTRSWAQYPVTFVNPPYGKAIRAWYGKIAEEAAQGAVIVAILPCARYEQAYYQHARALANAECLVRKRVAFIRADTGDRVKGNPYATKIVGWNVSQVRFRLAFSSLGACFALTCLSGPPPEAEKRRRRVS